MKRAFREDERLHGADEEAARPSEEEVAREPSRAQRELLRAAERPEDGARERAGTRSSARHPRPTVPPERARVPRAHPRRARHPPLPPQRRARRGSTPHAFWVLTAVVVTALVVGVVSLTRWS